MHFKKGEKKSGRSILYLHVRHSHSHSACDDFFGEITHVILSYKNCAHRVQGAWLRN
jgi:hypothetical protein